MQRQGLRWTGGAGRPVAEGQRTTGDAQDRRPAAPATGEFHGTRVDRVVGLASSAVEVEARRRSICRGGARDVIDHRRARSRPVVAERHVVSSASAQNRRIRQRQRTPADVDPVVALVHRRGRCQVEDRVGHGRVRNARRHVVAQAAVLRRNPRAVAVLAQNGRIGSRVVQSRTRIAAGCRDVRQHRVGRGQGDARRMIVGSRVPAHADVPVARPRYARARASCDDRAGAVRGRRVGHRLVQRGNQGDHVLLVQRSRAEPAHRDVEGAVLEDHVVVQLWVGDRLAAAIRGGSSGEVARRTRR